jgi:hypothetical protein
MKIPTTQKEREKILTNLRQAVALQIARWDISTLIEDETECDLEWVMNYISATAVVADDGMELSYADLGDFLGIGTQRNIVGKPLPEQHRQIH